MKNSHANLIQQYNFAAPIVGRYSVLVNQIQNLNQKVQPKAQFPRITTKGAKYLTAIILAACAFVAWRIYSKLHFFQKSHQDWRELIRNEAEFAQLGDYSPEESMSIAKNSHPEPQSPLPFAGPSTDTTMYVLTVAGGLFVLSVVLLLIYSLLRKRVSNKVFARRNQQRTQKNVELNTQIQNLKKEGAQLEREYYNAGLPFDYFDPYSWEAIGNYARGGRASTLQEAINLLEMEKRQEQQFKQLRADQQRMHNERLRQNDAIARSQLFSDILTRDSIDNLRR